MSLNKEIMQTTVKQRLINFIKYKELSQKKFEEIVGMSNGYVNNISKGIGPYYVNKIKSVFPELNIAWLTLGEGDMLNTNIEQVKRDDEPTTAAVVDFREDTIARLQAEVDYLRRQNEKLIDMVNRLTDCPAGGMHYGNS